MFFKIGVLKNFTNFTGKHLLKRFQHRCFPVKFTKFLRTPFFTEQLRWLVVHFITYERLIVGKNHFLENTVFKEKRS